MQSHFDRMQVRARVTRAVREFFEAQDFLEVDTPVALTAPAPEQHIEAPEVTFSYRYGMRPTHHQATSERRFLQTSPELPMKRLLALGFPRIFQIAPVFRDGEWSAQHRPEFRLLEWYRAHAEYTALLTDCENLLRFVCRAAGRELVFSFQGKKVDLTEFHRITVEEAFLQYAQFSILGALERAALQHELRRLQVRFDATDTWDDLFNRVFLEKVEPHLLKSPHPLFLTHYPYPLAALAQRCPSDPRVAERFELYVGGLELANGFGELRDSKEQRLRFERERKARLDKQMKDYPLDEHFLLALDKMPKAAGIALGFDRLLMILLEAADIEEIAFIPWSAA